MGLRFFRAEGWGWVRINAGLITESAHPREKPAPSFTRGITLGGERL